MPQLLSTRQLKIALYRAVTVVFISGALTAFTPSANAMRIQEVISPGGIKALLVEEHRVPLITVHFGFEGGSSQDPPGKSGRAHFVSGLMDEGAGNLDARAFQERLEELAVRLEFDAGRDVFYGAFQTLTKHKDEAFGLLKLALTEPRFDEDAVERIRSQILASLNFDLQDPQKVAAREWFRTAFKDHPYAQPVKGMPASISAISRTDLLDFVNRTFARDNLKIAVVGDITAEELKDWLDRVFGTLPAKADLNPVPDTEPAAGPVQQIVEMRVPQSVAQFGQKGFRRKHKDFYAAYVLNYIIGGGGFSSKLMEEVREKRGLAYSVYSYLFPLEHAGLFIGGVATKNEAVAESLDVIRAVLKRVAEEGPSAEEVESAKRYLIGSYPLRFDTSAKIAEQLLQIQIQELGNDYIEKRNQYIEAVTLDDVRRVAGELLQPGRLIITIVGQPQRMQEELHKPPADVRG